MTEPIKLPPLPEPDLISNGIECYVHESLLEYTSAAIEADRKTTDKQLAAYKRITESLESRIVLLQNQYDELKKTTDPSLLASERAANALLTQEVEALEADRQARGEPVAWISDSPTKGNGKRLFLAKTDAWRWSSNIEPLYTIPQIPEGYKLVPIEPTEEMIESGWMVGDVGMEGIYKAMLEAAPEPKGRA